MHIAILSPTFHGYYLALRSGFEQLGHEVRALGYDRRSTLPEKLSGKFRVDLARQAGASTLRHETDVATGRADEFLGSESCDLVVVVKGDVIDPEWVERRRRGGALALLWLYDELHRSRHTEDHLRAYDAVASYSRGDVATLSANGINAIHVPGAFDATMPQPALPRNTTPDLVFVGARYGGRAEVLAAAQSQGLRVAAYGRDWSRHPLDRLRTTSWARPAIPAGRDVPLHATSGIISKATATLNVHHDQDGFTMRTFEIGGVRGLQLIDRADVEEFYDPGSEVLVFHDDDELVEHVQHARRDPAWASSIRVAAHSRTLAQHTFTHRCERLLSTC